MCVVTVPFVLLAAFFLFSLSKVLIYSAALHFSHTGLSLTPELDSVHEHFFFNFFFFRSDQENFFMYKRENKINKISLEEEEKEKNVVVLPGTT